MKRKVAVTLMTVLCLMGAAAAHAQTYQIGDTGPAGGIIFYDKGNARGGWRYMEAAPASAETKAKFAADDSIFKYNYDRQKEYFGDPGPEEEIGTGKFLSETFAKILYDNGQWDMATQVCQELEINGFSDWYLPNFLELSQMYGNLHRKELGDFQDAIYLSSYRGGIFIYGIPLTMNFKDGSRPPSRIDSTYLVRAARRF